MSNAVGLDEVESLVAQLPPPDRLKLVARVCEQLSLATMEPLARADQPAQQGQLSTDNLLALCDAAAEMWEGEFDAVAEIRQTRAERDERAWPSK